MSVVWIGGQRFAAGLLWQRGLLKGGPARRAAKDSGTAWTVEVAGQTGFVDDTEGPGGTRPLAGALKVLLRGRSDGDETWIALVEEDLEEGGDEAADRRVAVVRCSGGLLLADGDVVFASSAEAVDAVGGSGLEDVTVAATPGLLAGLPDAIRIDGAGVREAAVEVDLLSEVRSRRISGKGAVWLGILAVVGVAGILGWTNRTPIGIWLGLAEEKKERPRVTVGIESRRFLAYCRDEIGRRELGLVGFDRIAVLCHAQYQPDGAVGGRWELAGRPVLEVRWRLRKPLPARVYVGLAEARLAPWYWAGVNDNGDAAGFARLPQVLVKSDGADAPGRPEFRARIDALLALRGFRIEYAQDSGVEVVLETERPLSEAVALVSGIEGLEVFLVAFESGRWRFEARRSRAQVMFEDEFVRLTAPLTRAVPASGESKPKRIA